MIYLKLLITFLLISVSLIFLNIKLSSNLIVFFPYNYYFYIFLILFFTQISIGVRWYLLTNFYNKKIKILEAINFGFRFSSFGSLTFTGGSDIYKFFNSEKLKINLSEMSSVIIIEKISSFSSIILMILIGIILNLGDLEKTNFIIFVLVVLFFLLLTVLSNMKRIPYVNLINFSFQKIKQNLLINKNFTIMILLVSFLTQILSLLLYFIFFSYFTEITFKSLLLIIPLSNLIISISFFTFNGVGIRELAFILFSGLTLISQDISFIVALNASFLITFYMIISYLIANKILFSNNKT
tara:strand:+ start:1141 stop:2031 length:891 start_codon:yes stop_codon:yes gene_type:complete